MLFFKTSDWSEFLFGTFSFCSHSEVKSNEKRNFFFFPLANAKSTLFFLFPKCCLFQTGEMFFFAINKKKTTQTFIHHFFFQNNKICFEFGQTKFDPQMQYWGLGYKMVILSPGSVTWISSSPEVMQHCMFRGEV